MIALSALEDQTWGGIIMWGVGGAIDMIVVLGLLYRLLSGQKGLGLAPRPTLSPEGRG